MPCIAHYACADLIITVSSLPVIAVIRKHVYNSMSEVKEAAAMIPWTPMRVKFIVYMFQIWWNR